MHRQPSRGCEAPMLSSAPLYDPLGFTSNKHGEPFFVFKAQTGVVSYRAPEIGIGGLLTLHPDMGHWRALYPARKGHGVDVLSASAALIRACQAKGPYKPDSDK